MITDTGEWIGQVLSGRYQVIAKLGEGGMAFVYVANDEKLGRKVAIKVLHEHMEKNPDIRKRFQWCNVSVRANDLPPDAREYGDIEMALAELNQGEKIKVSTDDGSYMERA